ncbi:MAG: hypothetical protein FRX49_04701 [Trebouxia sp. A1-2]|nr:MAG: hypothetical protein FRX49_04701 [Trebouxia sp. A1-2]
MTGQTEGINKQAMMSSALVVRQRQHAECLQQQALNHLQVSIEKSQTWFVVPTLGIDMKKP